MLSVMRDSFSRSDVGVLVDARPGNGLPDGRPVKGLLFRATVGAEILVTVKRGSYEATRRFHIGPARTTWINVGHVECVKAGIRSIGVGGEVSCAWTTEPPQELGDLVLFQVLAGAGPVAVPEGARAVIASAADAAATQALTVDATTFTVATPLLPATEFAIFGSSLTLGGGNTLAWILGGL